MEEGWNINLDASHSSILHFYREWYIIQYFVVQFQVRQADLALEQTDGYI